MQIVYCAVCGLDRLHIVFTGRGGRARPVGDHRACDDDVCETY